MYEIKYVDRVIKSSYCITWINVDQALQGHLVSLDTMAADNLAKQGVELGDKQACYWQMLQEYPGFSTRSLN